MDTWAIAALVPNYQRIWPNLLYHLHWQLFTKKGQSGLGATNLRPHLVEVIHAQLNYGKACYYAK